MTIIVRTVFFSGLASVLGLAETLRMVGRLQVSLTPAGDVPPNRASLTITKLSNLDCGDHQAHCYAARPFANRWDPYI